MSVSAAVTILAACVSAVAVVGAAWLANSIHRQLKLQLEQGVQERRLAAYEGLWAAMEKSAAIRLKGDWAGGPLTKKERKELFHEMTSWYYGKSGGIYLQPRTRSLYLQVKENLLCSESDIKPEGALEELLQKLPDERNTTQRRSLLTIRRLVPLRSVTWHSTPDARNTNQLRSLLALRQLSLLRWVMRFDLTIQTEPYFHELMPKERELLERCKIELYKPPYYNHWRFEPTKPPVT